MTQEELREFWHTSSAPYRLTAWQKVRALALRDVSREMYDGHVKVNWIATKLRKTDGTCKAYSDDPVQHGSVCEFFEKVDADPEWFPGKHYGEKKRGPKPVFTKSKRARVASSGMSQKADGEEPCVDVTIVKCPAATWNPITKKPFCDKTIRKVWLTECYDFDPAFPWKYQYPLQKIAIPTEVCEYRMRMLKNILEVQEHGDSIMWWSQHVVWIDPCASVLPRSRLQYVRMRTAELGNKKRLISNDAKEYNRNLRGRKETLKQASYSSMRISWFIVLARGKVAIEMLPEEWQLNGAGMAEVIELLPGVLRRMLGENAHIPRVLFTDRGTGMYAPSGKVVNAYANAVNEAGFRLYWGPDAKAQSPDMGDLLLHETAVSWFRNRMRREKPVVLPWEETRAQWLARSTRCVRYINADHDVAGLCRQFPERLRSCKELDGGRIRK